MAIVAALRFVNIPFPNGQSSKCATTTPLQVLVHPRVSRNAPPGICKVTGKISHTTRDDAEAALKSVVWMNQSRGESDRSAGLNVYPCDGCDGWHFGHQREHRDRVALHDREAG